MRRNKLLKILLSAALAFSLWLYVITVVSPGSEKTYYDIPVVLQNENVLAERDLIITSYDSSVTLQLEGNRTDLNTMNESNINILANVSSIMAPGVHKVSYDVNYPGNIADNAIITNSKTPDMLTVNVENLVTKNIPVEYSATGTLPESYHPETPIYSVDGQPITQIQISGPESAISKIEYAMIYVDFAGRTESISADMEYTLCNEARQRVDVDAQLVTTNVPTIRMDMKIHRYMELPLAVELISGGGATEENCTVTITPIDKLTVSGEDRILKNMDAIVIGSVDLAKLQEDTTMKLPLTMPEGVTNRTEGYEEVEVKLELKGLRTKTLQVTQFRVINKPLNMTFEGIPSSMTLELRGPSEQIEKLKATDITIIVDLKSAQTGVNPIQVKPEFAAGFQGVGVLSDNEVIVTVKAPQ